MRSDSFGLFWEDAPPERGKRGQKERVRPQPPIPDTGWKPPRDLPNLFHARVLGIDTETFDPELKTHGPGWGRGVGHIVGFSLATDDGYSYYLPIRHEVQREFNLDPETVIRYMRDLMARPMPKVGHSLTYDIGWMGEEDIHVAGKLHDVAYAEALLFDTARSYTLDSVGRRWIGEGKTEDELYAWLARAYGGKPVRKDQAGNIYRSPPALAGPYAEVDAEIPIRVFPKQWKALADANLLRVYNLEVALIPVLIGMRKRGLPISRTKAEEVKGILQGKLDAAQMELNKEASFEVGVYTDKDLTRLFDSKGIDYPRTKKGNPSFRKEWLANHPHPVGKKVQNVRRYDKALSTFVQNAILDKEKNGKLYPSFHPLRGEDGGAVSGRYSSSMPNAQQIPARDKELAPLLRSIFVPEDGFPSWIKQDLSQIEYRFFAHFSGDQRLITQYQDPKTDYHHIVSGFLGHKMPRKPIKNFNFMKLFGGGIDKTIFMLHGEFNKQQVEELLLSLIGEIPKGDPYIRLAHVFTDMYEENFPAASESLKRDMDLADRYGEIRTILGRRSTFDLWERAQRSKGDKIALPYEKAVKFWGQYSIQRAFCYAALNRRLQGSAADLLKKGMLKAYEEGIFDIIGFPHVTVHDELDNSYHPDLKPWFLKLQLAIENAIRLRVPVMLGAEIGTNWGDVKEIDLAA